MKEKDIKTRIFALLTIFPIVGILAIGRPFDERLLVLDAVNISVVVTLAYMVSILLSFLRFSRCNSFLGLGLYLVFATILLSNYGHVLVTSNGIDMLLDGENLSTKKFVIFFSITLPVSLFFLLDKSQKYLETFFFVLFLVSLLLLGAGFFSFLKGNVYAGNRTVALGGGPIVLARWLFYGLFYSIFFIKSKKVVKYILIFSFLFMSFTTGSKGPLLMGVITASMYFILTWKERKVLLNATVILVAGLIVTNFVTIIEFLDIKGSKRLLVLASSSEVVAGTSGSSRVNRITGTFEMLQDNLFFGVGLGKWGDYILYYEDFYLGEFFSQGKYPHNILIEIASELGLVSVLPLLILIILAYIKLIREICIFKFQHSKFIFVILTFNFLSAQTSGDLSDARMMFIWLSIAIAAKIIKKRPLS